MSLCDCSNIDTTTISPIEFSGSLIKFRFIDIDVNVTVNLESGDFLFIPGFKNSDSVAHINIPKNFLNELFLFNITNHDLKNYKWDNMKYAMDSSKWMDVSFCNAIVNKTNTINPNARFKYVHLDFTRYLIKSITNSIYQNGVFRNKDSFIQKSGQVAGNLNAGMVENLGELLFKKYIVPFEISSILFIASMVGAVLLAKREKPIID